MRTAPKHTLTPRISRACIANDVRCQNLIATHAGVAHLELARVCQKTLAMRSARFQGPLDTPMTTQHQKEAGGMRTPHRRDISARQDLLGRELRQLFDDYTQEDMPDDLQDLAERLQAAFEGREPDGEAGAADGAAQPAAEPKKD